MSEPKSLTIASIINLVGEEKLYASIENQLYLYVPLYAERGQVDPPRIFMFRTDANPIEYLIFNNIDFMQLMLYSAPRKENTKKFMTVVANYLLTIGHNIWKEYINDPDFNVLSDTDFVEGIVDIMQITNEVPGVIAEAAWHDIGKLTCKELKVMMDSVPMVIIIYISLKKKNKRICCILTRNL